MRRRNAGLGEERYNFRTSEDSCEESTFAHAVAGRERGAAGPIVWTRGAQNSTEEYLDGKLIRTIQQGGIRVSASLFATSKDAVAAEIYVVNDSDRPVNVIPDQMFVSATPAERGAKTAYLGIVPSAALIADVNSNAKIRAALDQLGANFETTTSRTQSVTSANVTLLGSKGITTGTVNGTTESTTVGPDWQARRLAAYKQMQLYAMARDRVAAIQADALKANTVHPGGAYGGIVWESKHRYFSQAGTQIVLDILLDETTFQFPDGLR